MNSTAKTAAIIAAIIAATVGGLSAADAANPRGPVPAPPAYLDQPPAQVDSSGKRYTLAEVKRRAGQLTDCQRQAMRYTYTLPVPGQKIIKGDNLIFECKNNKTVLIHFKNGKTEEMQGLPLKDALNIINYEYDNYVNGDTRHWFRLAEMKK